MSGGRLVVLDRAGRDVKYYPLAEGLATLGSDPACDIRIMLPTVSPHHATVVVHSMQTVVQSVSERETLVNGARVSVAALRHGDVIALGGRALRWEYLDRAARRPLQPHPALHRRLQRVRAPRRASEPPPKDIIVATHRASMPASASGKQVAIVQPQRRDTSDLSDAASSLSPNKRPRTSKNSNSFSELMENNDKTRRKVSSPRNTLAKLSNPTKATLWIESRKSSPRKSATKPQTPVRSPAKTPVRSPAKTPVESPIQTRKSIRTPGKSPEKTEVTLLTAYERRTRTPAKSPEKKAVKTPQRTQNKTLTPLRNVRKVVSEKKRYGPTPLRLVVLKKAQSAQKMKVTKIQAPLKMDSTKQAAIMLMTRHTPKSKQPSPAQGKGPSFLVKKPSPVPKTPKQATRSSGRTSSARPTPTRSSMYGRKKTSEGNRASDKYVSENESLIEITDSETPSSLTRSNTTRRSTSRSSLFSPSLPSPKKSALKDPSAKKSSRKSESIKFDLSNLESTSHNRSSDVMLVDDPTKNYSISDTSETECTLRYSDSSNTKTPTPRSSSRTDRMLERSLGTSITEYPTFTRRSVRNESSQLEKSPRGIKMIKKALEKSDASDVSSYSRRTTKSLNPTRTSNASARLTRTLSPRASNNLESYSIVDLVSINSNDSLSNRSGSIYNSAGSVSSNATYDTPVLGSSTPYESRSNSTAVFSVRGSTGRKRSRGLVVSTTMVGKSSLTSDIVTTPENTMDATKITYDSTRISRASKSRSRINDSDVLLTEGEEDSPKSSKRLTRVSQSSPVVRKNISVNETPSSKSDSPSTVGMHTPENRHSPVEASTPVLSIQSLLDASQHSLKLRSPPKRNMKRKTIGALHSEPKKSWMSRSLNLGRSLRGRDITANFDRRDNNSQDDEGIVTPTSAVKLVPEGVKNKHSTAKKPKSKRSLIDNLDESDIVKQLFNSPVKRKLSQSMTEFSRKQLFEDDDVRPVRQTRSTIAVVGTTPDTSLVNNTEAFTPEVFVSPLNTPSSSPNMTGIKRLFQKSTPENDLRKVSGVKALLRTPRTRKSIKNDLTKVTGVKAVFAKSPRNRLSDVRVKEVFAASPKNDLRRISGVKSLFQSQKKKDKSPRNELDDVRGVRNLFRETRSSPRNDLSDVRGVKQMFRQEKQLNNLSDVSGVEQLFQEPENFDSTFDQLMGRPPIRATYIKAKSFTVNRVGKKKNKKVGLKSLHDSISQITENVQEWLEKELQSRVQRNAEPEASTSKGRESSPNKSKNNSKMNLARELQKLSTNTVEGTTTQVTISRTRNSSMIRNENDHSSQKKSASELYGAHTLPIKKRSLIEASINNTNDRFSRSKQLPIKKRAVVHSTPVKGRVNITMNASEIGRMSPISAEKILEIDTIIRPETQSSPKTKQSPKNKQSPKGKQFLKAKAIEEAKNQKENSIVTANPSPKKTRSAKTAQSTPVNAVRGRKSINEKQEPNVKKRRSSIVITKKPPVISPKPAAHKVTRKGKANTKLEQEVVNPSPKKTRATRGQKLQASAEVKIVTPKKNTRAKVRRSSVVVVKPSPKLKPRATRRTKETEGSVVEQQVQAEAKRKAVAVTEPKSKSNNKIESLQESKVEVEPVRKTRKTIAKAASKDESQVAVQPSRTTRKTIVKDESKGNSMDIEILVVQTRRTKKTVENESAQNIKEVPNAQTKRGRKVAESKAIEEQKATKTRGKTVVPQSSVESETTRRGRRTKAEETVVQASAKTQGRKLTLEQSIPKTVGRGRKTQVAPESDKKTSKVPDSPPKTAGRGRKRKNTEPEDSSPAKEVPVKATKQTRSTKTTVHEDKEVKKPGKAKSESKGAGDASNAKRTEKKAKTAVEPRKSTRSAAQTVVEEKPVRGKKAAAAEKVVEKDAPQESGRKKRTNVDISDAKDSKKQPAKRARTAAAPPAPPARTARARAAPPPARAARRAR